MLSANKSLIAVCLAVLLGALVLSAPLPVHAANTCAGLEQQFQQLDPSGPEAQALLKKFPRHCSAVQALSKAITIALSVAAAAATIAIMFGGFLMVTSAGNEEQFGKGKRALTAAVIGLIVIILAGLIVNLVSNIIVKGAPF